MNKTIVSKEMPPLEKLLVSADTPPWDAVFRTAIGYAILPAMSRLWSANRSGWTLVPFLLGVLVMLRVVPTVIRKLVPFSDAALKAWAERRRIAKRYDSYQWQKLFWIGFGIALYTAFSGQFLTSRIVVSSFCLLSGALGLVRWRAMASRPDSTSVPAKQARDIA